MSIRPSFLLPILGGLLFGCGPPAAPGGVGPAVDADALALGLEAETRLAVPTRVVFDWNINESGARFHGRGVARMAPEYRARLDLFLANGEPVVSAALVQDDLRLPGAAPEGLIPPGPLLWASLGVFRPGAQSRLLGGEEMDGGRIRLRYALPTGVELHYELAEGVIARASLLSEGEVMEAMELTPGADEGALPSAARYRNIAAFRELHVEADRVEVVDDFPAEIWTLEG